MIELANGAIIIDTPGMREIGLIGSQTGIDNTFEDILSLSKHCRFNDCTHTKEKGCAVLAALLGKFYKSVMKDILKKKRG